jgi:hypothetical protein
MTETELEKSFQKSKQLLFFKAEDYSAEPPIISIVFDKSSDGIEAYEYLLKNLTKDEISLVFRIVDNEKISLTLIDKKESNVYNIDNLNFSKTEYDDFRNNGEFGKYCVFCISEIVENQVVFTLTEGTSPLMVSELNFSK